MTGAAKTIVMILRSGLYMPIVLTYKRQSDNARGGPTKPASY